MLTIQSERLFRPCQLAVTLKDLKTISWQCNTFHCHFKAKMVILRGKILVHFGTYRMSSNCKFRKTSLDISQNFTYDLTKIFALADLHWTQLYYQFLSSFQIANKIVSLKFPNNRRLERIVFHKFFLSVPQQPKKAIHR